MKKWIKKTRLIMKVAFLDYVVELIIAIILTVKGLSAGRNGMRNVGIGWLMALGILGIYKSYTIIELVTAEEERSINKYTF